MSSIPFFTPVIYNNQIKTRAQQVLETVDEYFYLGNKLRVTIFAPDATHPQAWGLSNRQDRCRSWKNIALKIISYMTLFLPLVALTAKALLRRHLKVSSIQVQSQFVANSVEDRLPVYVLQNIGSFLSFRDQDQLAQVAHFTQNAARKTQQLTASLKAEVATLPADPIGREDCQRLLVKLITSPAAGRSKHWASVMNAFMRHVLSNSEKSEKVDDTIQDHAYIADLLATSEQPISPDQIYQFCKYLGNNQLSHIYAWVGYRVLEQYLLTPQLNVASINKALKEYLTQIAQKKILAENSAYILSNNQKLKFQVIPHIDPRFWFGRRGIYSLWTQPSAQNGEMTPMPELLLDVLWTHIQTLHASCRDKPFIVNMTGREEAKMPYNFTLKLAQLITNAGMFLEHGNTIDTEKLDNPRYARHFTSASLASEYPQAVKNL